MPRALRLQALLAVTVAFPALAMGSAPEGTVQVRDAACGVEVALPDASWTLRDESDGTSVVHLYAPDDTFVPRACLIQTPLRIARGGLADRAFALEVHHRTRMRITLGSLGGAEAQRTEYSAGNARHVELGIRRGEDYLVFQIVAEEAAWTDPKRRKVLDGILESVRLLRGPVPAPVDRSTPEEIRAARRGPGPPRPIAIRSHDIALEISPEGGGLACVDRLEVAALADDVREIPLLLGPLEVDAVLSDGKPLRFLRVSGTALLLVDPPRPLPRGGTLALEVRAHADRLLVDARQSLVAEVQVLGQVRADSSFSSHVAWYPTAEGDDAPVRLSISVPEGYRAVGGGDALGEERRGDRRVFRFEVGGGCARPLPLGFAVGKYETLRGSTPGGLALEVHSLPGAPARAAAALGIARRAATRFEELFGPLPWRRVAICQARPVRGEAGVSLPAGLVLLSDCFERDVEGVEPSTESLADPVTRALISIPDEISHQWNFYAALLPNELAEGVATFSDLLFLEREKGEAAYLAGVRDCARSCLGTLDVAGDVALADPDLYASPAYRMVAFAKVPVVLHGLRRRLGERAFFAGLREAIGGGHGGPDAYAEFRGAFEKASGEPLGGWFDSWFFRAGTPKIAVRVEGAGEGGIGGGRVVVGQVQDGGPYEIDFEIELRGPGSRRSVVPVRMRGREVAIPLEPGDPPGEVVVDPGETGLVRQVEGR